VLAVGFARIHWQNLVNFGVVPLTFANQADYGSVNSGDQLHLVNLHSQLDDGSKVLVKNKTQGTTITIRHSMSTRQLDVLRAGGLINWVKNPSG
jgi:aconitate hydratase